MEISNPRQEVLQLLVQASSQNLSVLKYAEEKLKAYECVAGFYSTLMDVVMDQNLDLNARWQAVIYFKNGIDRYWRRRAPGAIGEEEKDLLRSKLMYCFKEPVNQIATQLAVLIAKVARLDYPHQWPTLMPALLEAVKQRDTLDEHRGLLVLNHVVKSLSSKRLAGDRRLFQEVTGNLFNMVCHIWNSRTECFMAEATQRNNNCLNTLQKALLSLKIIRKLIVHGFKEPHQSIDVMECISLVFVRLKSLIELRIQFDKNAELTALLEQYIVFLMKLLIDVLDHHPFSYIQFIEPSLNFAISYVLKCTTEGLIFEKLLINCLNLVKGLILCVEYRQGKTPDEAQHPLSLQAFQIKQKFFTELVLSEICYHLVCRYFLFTREDLQTWEDDPECFALEEKGESWKYNLRVCTEVLFVAVFHEYRQVLTPVLIGLLKNNEQSEPVRNISDILKKEAVYNAVGLAAFELFDAVDFDQWLVNSLIKELQRREPEYKIIRRRVIWMIGQWVAVKLSTELRPLLYESILPLLRVEEDMVVRITAAETLKIAVDDFEFNSEQFLPYLESSFGLLFQLLKDVSGSDAKMHVLHVLSFVVERVGGTIRPYASALVNYLPLLWNESADHNMLRCAILSTLHHLVEGFGALSEDLHPFLVPVINFSTDVKQEPHVYLLEDGLELWNVTLENAHSIGDNMFILFNNLLPLLELSSESMRTCFNIIQAYTLLVPVQFKTTYLPHVIEVCKSLVHELRNEGIIIILRLVEIVLKAYGSEGPTLCLPILPYIFRAVIHGQEYPVLMSLHLSVVSKTVLSDTACFTMILKQLSQELNRPPEDLFRGLLDVWLEKLPLVTHMDRRKSLGLGLASILTSYTSIIGDHYCGILLGIVEVLNDVLRSDDDSRNDSLLITEADLVYEENEKEHSKRKKQLSLRDPVHTVDLIRYTSSQLNSVKLNVGATAFEDLMGTVDVETMSQLKDLLKHVWS
ncbi:Importin-11 [Chamberlinius hualienensis]